MKFSKKQALALAARRKGYAKTGSNPKHEAYLPGSQNRKKGYGKRAVR